MEISWQPYPRWRPRTSDGPGVPWISSPPSTGRATAGLHTSDLIKSTLEDFLADQQAFLERETDTTCSEGGEDFGLARSVVADLSVMVALVHLTGDTTRGLVKIKQRHDRRVGLDELSDATLARRKDFVPEGVPRLWRTGRIVEVLDRNRSDVELARDVYAFGRDFGYVVAREENGVGFEQFEVD